MLYSAVAFSAISRHEPWSDEAQAWLLARDASLVELWTRLSHLEGSPLLWHSLLHGMIQAGMPYRGMNILSGALGVAATAILVRYSPFPLVIRLLLPFSYFLCYQYAVVARSYSLAPALIFSIAAVYKLKPQSARLLATLLGLLALVSTQALLVSLSFATILGAELASKWTMMERQTRRHATQSAFCYAAVLLGATIAVWPNGDTTFVVSPRFSLPHFIGISRYAFQQAFGEGYWPLIILLLSFPELRRGLGLPFFALASATLCLFGAFIYSNVWHHGFLVLAWLFALWISHRPLSRIGWSTTAALIIFLAIQCSWTWKAIVYDRKFPYSGSFAMAHYLGQPQFTNARIFGIGFPTVAVEPYLSRGFFKNFSAEGQQSYWLWSKNNTINDSSERLGSEHPDYVLLGYNSDAERNLWGYLITNSGYRLQKEFNGNTFWQTSVFQAENYQLFARGTQTEDTLLASKLDLARTEANHQISWGLSVPYDTGRWSSGSFGVWLQRPAQASEGSRFELSVHVNSEYIQRVGSISVTAYVAGRPIHLGVIKRGGDYQYINYVAARDLFWTILPVAVQFEKEGFTTQELTGEQVALVEQIGLSSK